MEYLPVNLLLRDRAVVLIGAGVVAARKARFLLTAGADLRIIAPHKDGQFEQLEELGPMHWESREYREGDLEGAVVAIAATPIRAVNEAVHAEATARSIPVNVVDSPDLCTFIFPAIIDRTPITVAVSSGGASPVLARAIRSRIEAMLPSATAEIASFGRRFRDRVKAASVSERDRRGIWEQVINGSIAQLILKNRVPEAEDALEALLASHAPAVQGEVYLIGAGPGDPELMTFKALRLLQRADIVLYDRLVNPEIVAMARRDAEKLYVGKQRAQCLRVAEKRVQVILARR